MTSHAQPQSVDIPKGDFTKQLITALIWVAAFEILFLIPAVKVFAVENLQLTNADLIMVPIGTISMFLFWKMMQKDVFSPLLKLQIAREAATSGSLEQATELRAQSAKLAKEYDQELSRTTKQAVGEKESEISAEQALLNQKIQEAETTQNQLTRKSREDLQQEVKALRTGLEQNLEQLVDQAVEKISK